MSNNSKDRPWPVNKQSGMVAWESPANIALVKYWGKYPVQMPMNPSISFVLQESVVRLRLAFSDTGGKHSGVHAFLLNGQPNNAFRDRIAGFLESLHPVFPFLGVMRLSISSESTFPHSAGIASSAAAFSALSLCLCEMERMAGITDAEKTNPVDRRHEAGEPTNLPGEAWRKSLLADPGFIRKASHIARLGSGSACRSLQDGFVVWGKTSLLDQSHDEYALRVDDEVVAPVFYTLRDAVLIVDDTTKKVSSSAGHALMHTHAYRHARKEQVDGNLGLLLKALKEGDEDVFFRVLENEALSLHSLMMSSNPGYILLKPNTIRLLDMIRDFREQHGVKLGFTMDAGPNIHLLYLERDKQVVHDWINSQLLPLCKNQTWIDDAMGKGPQPLSS